MRKKQGLSLREAANRTGISHPYLSQLENGRNENPSNEILTKLASGFNVNYFDLAMHTEDIKKLLEQEGLIQSTELYKLYKEKKDEEIQVNYKENDFHIDELLSADIQLKYGGIILSEEDKRKILTFIKEILLK